MHDHLQNSLQNQDFRPRENKLAKSISINRGDSFITSQQPLSSTSTLDISSDEHSSPKTPKGFKDADDLMLMFQSIEKSPLSTTTLTSPKSPIKLAPPGIFILM